MAGKPNSRGTIEERFDAKVRKSQDCWEWIGGKDSYGYGYIWFNGRLRKATHVSLWLFRGEDVGERFALHHCDNPSCVNPDHLFIGDQHSNMRDCSQKGRIKNQKVTDLRAVRGMTPKDIAERFGVCHRHAYKLRRNSLNG